MPILSRSPLPGGGLSGRRASQSGHGNLSDHNPQFGRELRGAPIRTPLPREPLSRSSLRGRDEFFLLPIPVHATESLSSPGFPPATPPAYRAARHRVRREIRPP